MEHPTYLIEGKPHRIVTFYIPAFLALLFGFSADSDGASSWQQLLCLKVAGTVASFCFLWPFVLAFYHGYCFFYSLFAISKQTRGDK